ncbi:MAG: SCO family protein [Acidobacteria bacterium]|nr:SCO family protein [Acidobacteriota bacterium]MCA1650112.1 SCO family protein [Acidobacteriota bacterium]
MSRSWPPLALLSVLLSGCAVGHQARGLVLRVDPAASAVTVSHEAIPGYMDAMVMRFTAANPSDLADVRPGDRIQFRIKVTGNRTVIDRVALLSAAPADDSLIMSPAKPSLVAIGQLVPDFTLTNQDGYPVSLASLHGKVVALTFIYTRCPLPDYCPRMMAHLNAVRDRFGDRLNVDLALLTLTFDPKYDTPAQMKQYAQHYRADVPGWHFLTGGASQIARVCSLFGVEFWPDEGLITHTLQTAVIDREGRLAATIEGKDFSARQLGDLIDLFLTGNGGGASRMQLR